MPKLLQQLIDYAQLGYDVSFTTIYGKEAIRMIKKYSHPAEKPLLCEQVYNHSELLDESTLHKVLQYLYEDIQQQEDTGVYHSSTEEYLNI